MSNTPISEFGIVGCGGAGFPTHVKLAAKGIDFFIVNGAECEPLLHKDKEILHHYAGDFFKGLLECVETVGAKKAFIGIKKKYSDLIAQIETQIPDSRIQILKLGDFYPAGDEFELVYEATSRLIPFGGIPLQVGCVVSNVETVLNVGRAKPVVTKFLTIAGAVPKPLTVEVPIGISYKEALSISGLNDFYDLAFIDGGPMMGKPIASLDDVITKTTGGIVVLPRNHQLIKKMTRPEGLVKRLARSSCDQCTDCSELCPRRLLGYPIHPHKAMRAAQVAPFGDNDFSADSVFCSECGLCSLYSCPEDLPPREVTVLAKKFHLGKGKKLSDWKGSPIVHPMRAFRRVSIPALLRRLGLTDFDKPAPLVSVDISPQRVKLPLKMHLGMPVVPLVKPGDEVFLGQKIGDIPEGKLGAALHSSLAGKVESVDAGFITIVRVANEEKK